MPEYVEYIGLLAGLIFSFSGIAQAIKIVRLKHADSISITTYIMMIVGMVLWSVYAVYHQAWMFVFWNSLAAGVKCVVLCLKLYYERIRRI